MLRLLCLAALLLPLSSLADEPPRTVGVSGSATIYAVPDQAVVLFNVQTFDKDLAKSKQMNDEQGRGLLEFIKSIGVDDKYIQTESMRTNAEYEEVIKEGYRTKGGLTGYTTKRSYSVTLKDLSKFATLTDHLLVNPSVFLSRYDFDSSELQKYEDEARREAIKTAKQKASLLAERLDCRIGRAREIRESGSSRGGASLFGGSKGFLDSASDSSSPVRPGQIAVTAEVDVVFDLLPQ